MPSKYRTSWLLKFVVHAVGCGPNNSLSLFLSFWRLCENSKKQNSMMKCWEVCELSKYLLASKTFCVATEPSHYVMSTACLGSIYSTKPGPEGSRRPSLWYTGSRAVGVFEQGFGMTGMLSQAHENHLRSDHWCIWVVLFRLGLPPMPCPSPEQI